MDRRPGRRPVLTAAALPAALVTLALAACATTPSRPADAPRLVTVTIVGTSDIHGRISTFPMLGGYLRILRDLRARDGAVVLLDGGDIFQGTIESNMVEGAPMIDAMNRLGYAAAAVGNHDFDFGPAGAAPTPGKPGDDPRGALRERATEARFPMLMSNVVDDATGTRPDWKNVVPSVLVDLPPPASLKIGIVGATTSETPRTTIALNFRGLRMTPVVDAIAAEARALRERGADLVVVTAHVGGSCKRFDDPRDVDGACRADGEIFQVVRALPPGLVDAVVGGHTHQAVAHLVAGIPVVVSWSNGRAFGRIDLVYDTATRRVVHADLFPPRDLCKSHEGPCEPGRYVGTDVVPDPALAAAIAPALDRAAARKNEPLGVEVTAKIWKHGVNESPEGNLFADLLRQMTPGGDVALVNGGGLRADIPAGPLTYGAMFEAFPFDNKVAVAHTTGGAVRRIFEHYTTPGGGMSISGLRVRVRCTAGKLDVALFREDGRPVRDAEPLTLVTSDFLVMGGDGLLAEATAGAELRPLVIREEMVRLLRAQGGRLNPDDPAMFDKGHPRIDIPGPRPIVCGTP